MRCVNNPPPNGFGFAVRRGLAEFRGEAVAIVMADGSDDPAEGGMSTVAEVLEYITATERQKAVEKEQSGDLKLKKFYGSFQWRKLRYEFLRTQPKPLRCCLCNRSAADAVKLCCDHVKSVRRHPELKLSLSNLQVTCSECNTGKGSDWADDWRARKIEAQP